ncbi:MAG: glycoside hydrolase family 95 protein, partial [Clostridia bacterium]|nr:glycoside hydrolase family 95 protein [Clostridia bacterium]
QSVDLDMVSLMMQYGRYLLISSSQPGGQPANLQGVWNDKLFAPWDSKYTININAEMNYWPALVGNIAETQMPFFDMIRDLSNTGAETARQMYGCRGWVAHHNTDLWRIAGPVDGTTWGMFPTGGAWLTTHIWQHYLFTGDRIFLKDVAYEFIKESAKFFTQIMFEGPNGEMMTGPSTSPENAYAEIDPETGEKCFIHLTVSPTMDVQIVGGLFDMYIEIEDILNVDPELKAKVTEVRSRMPKMKIGKFGQLMEWVEDYEEFEPGHRHISHAFGLYPAAQITRKTPDLYGAIRVTLDRRLSQGGGHTGWSRAWLINLFARLRDGKGVGDNLRALLTNSTLPNLLDNHPPFQIDGNFGGAAAIAEMLIQSHEGFISILPALPPDIRDGSFKGLRARGNVTVSASWGNGKLETLTLEGECGKPVKVELPEKITVLTDGEKSRLTETGEITLVCGKTYAVL